MKLRAGVLLAALALVGVLALAVFPAQAYRDQRQHRRQLAAEVATLGTDNQALEARAAQLGTDAEIERQARGYNLVKPGEEVYFILPQAEPPTTAPAPPPPAEATSRSLWERITSIF